MPNYDYECQECREQWTEFRKIDDRRNVRCECGGETKILLGLVGVSAFQPGWWNDIAEEPIYIETPQQLREECQKRGQSSTYLENGVWKTSKGGEDVDEYHARKPETDSSVVPPDHYDSDQGDG